MSQINVPARPEIEARIAAPLIRVFIDELGRGILVAANRVIRLLARGRGRQLTKPLGGDSIADFAKRLSAWTAGDAYE